MSVFKFLESSTCKLIQQKYRLTVSRIEREDLVIRHGNACLPYYMHINNAYTVLKSFGGYSHIIYNLKIRKAETVFPLITIDLKATDFSEFYGGRLYIQSVHTASNSQNLYIAGVLITVKHKPLTLYTPIIT